MDKKLDLIIELLERHHLELQKVSDAVKVMDRTVAKLQRSVNELQVEKITRLLESVQFDVSDVDSDMTNANMHIEHLYYAISSLERAIRDIEH